MLILKATLLGSSLIKRYSIVHVHLSIVITLHCIGGLVKEECLLFDDNSGIFLLISCLMVILG